MKTDELISLLAAGAAPVPRRAATKTIAVAVAAGIALAASMMLLTMGARPDLGQAILSPTFWIKALFAAAVAGASFVTLTRLARPGVNARAGGVAISVPVLLLWVAAIAVYSSTPIPERAAMLWGQTWRICTLNIALISVPIFAAAFFALRQLAPTRLTQAGACAGALSGAASAAIYALHCPETALPFMALWYVAGIAVPTSVGAWLGPRVLKW